MRRARGGEGKGAGAEVGGEGGRREVGAAGGTAAPLAGPDAKAAAAAAATRSHTVPGRNRLCRAARAASGLRARQAGTGSAGWTRVRHGMRARFESAGGGAPSCEEDVVVQRDFWGGECRPRVVHCLTGACVLWCICAAPARIAAGLRTSGSNLARRRDALSAQLPASSVTTFLFSKVKFA